MANFTKKRLNPTDVNNGNRYADGNAAPSYDDLNDIVEGVMYADENADKAVSGIAEAVEKAETAYTKANEVSGIANEAKTTANEAKVTANDAKTIANSAYSPTNPPPEPNNPQITINQGGKLKGSFTLNQSTPEIINLDAGSDSVFRITGVALDNFSEGDLFKAKENGKDFFVKLENPAILPDGYGYSCAFNPDGTRLVVGNNQVNIYMIVYDTTTTPYTKLPNPTNLPPGTVLGCSYNHNGTRLAVAHLESPFITIYDTTTTPYTKITNPATLPTGFGRGCSYNHDGTRLAVAHSTSPYITVYNTTTVPYTKITNPTALPTGNGFGCSYNHDGTRLAVAHSTSPYITIYNTTTTPYTKLANPNALPTDPIGCAYNHDGTRLAVAHSASPFITIYDTTTVPYTKLANPTTLPSGAGQGCAYNHNSTKLAVVSFEYPYLTIYDTTTTPYTQFENVATYPPSVGRGCAFNYDGTKLAVAHETLPNITIYDTVMVVEMKLSSDRVDEDYTYFGYADKDVPIYATADFVLLHKLVSGGGEGTLDHAKLTNLDYEKSGHVGFAPTKNAVFTGESFDVRINKTEISAIDDLATLKSEYNTAIQTISRFFDMIAGIGTHPDAGGSISSISSVENHFADTGIAVTTPNHTWDKGDGKGAISYARLDDIGEGGTTVNVNNIAQNVVNFSSDPQTQISANNELIKKSVLLPDFDSTTFVLTFTTQGGETKKIDLPLEALTKDMDFDPVTKELILIKQDGSQLRIPLTALVDVYTGGQTAEITVSVSGTNEITASLRNGSIAFDRLNTALQTLINGKLTIPTGTTSQILNGQGSPITPTASTVGLGNVANERQYSSNNPQVNITGNAGSATYLKDFITEDL